jgi:hypothetical protein
MKSIDIKKLKPGDTILTFDSNLRIWIKCKIIRIEKYMITLEDLEGTLKGILWYVFPERLKNPDYYKQAG